MHPIDLAIIALYLILMVAVGAWVSKKACRNAESYFLAGIPDLSVSWFPPRGNEPEVDFILTIGTRRIPIEVKYTANPAPSDARGVERFLARFPRLARRGLVVCRVDRPEQLTRNVQAIPWEQL